MISDIGKRRNGPKWQFLRIARLMSLKRLCPRHDRRIDFSGEISFHEHPTRAMTLAMAGLLTADWRRHMTPRVGGGF